jgi:hypothetical protein
MTVRRWAVLAGILGTAQLSCAVSSRGPPSAPSREEEGQLLVGYERRIGQLEAELAAAAVETAAPPCPSACPLVLNICDLSERICQIAQRHAGEAELASRCRDASARCERARARIAPSCQCSQGV